MIVAFVFQNALHIQIFWTERDLNPTQSKKKEQCASSPPRVEPDGAVLLAALVTRGRHMYLEGNTARDIQ